MIRQIENIRYKLYVPCGNTTALVIGLEKDAAARRDIQDRLLSAHPEVEQVGFVNESSGPNELTMAGGEFCGNAARSAAYHYLDGKPGDIKIQVSGAKRELAAGVTDNLRAWVEMPVVDDGVSTVGDGLFLVKLEGIEHFVVSEYRSRRYLAKYHSTRDVTELLSDARAILSECEPSAGARAAATGVIFCGETAGAQTIHPCVFVDSLGTAAYETACGSGSAAVAAAHCHAAGCREATLSLTQPSGMQISAAVTVSVDKKYSIIISGPVYEI